MNKTGLIAKISIKYVLPICIWKYFWRISRYFAFFGEFRGISQKYLNFAGPRPREISEALYNIINCLLVNFRYFVAHTVGRPLIYPGSTGLLQSGFGNVKNNLECYFYWVYFYSHLYIRFAICR